MDKKEKAEKIRLYYANEMYEEDGNNVLQPVIAEGKSDVLLQPLFNPLSRIINNLYSLAFKNFKCTDTSVNDIWNFNNFTISKKKLIGDAILVGESYLEVVKSNNNIKYIFHKLEDIEEIEKDFGEIIKFSFTGTVKQINESGEVEEIEIKKIYFKVEDKVYLQINDENPLYIGDIMPVFEFNFGLDLFRALFYIDAYNEYESEARAIINIHASPERIAKNLGRPPTDKIDPTKQNGGILEQLFTKLRENRFRKQRTIIVEEKNEKTATIEYVEMSNTWVDKIIPKMEQLKKDFYEEFPELDLKLEAGNIAIRTFLMANEGLRSKISTIRDNFIGKVKEVDSYALNREISENSYVYSDIFKQIEDEADIDILNKKLSALEIVNRIQSDDKIVKLVNDLSEEILEGINDE